MAAIAWLGCAVVVWWIARWNVMHPNLSGVKKKWGKINETIQPRLE